MRILRWRTKRSDWETVPQILSRTVGEYAGRARYHPHGGAWLTPNLSRAVGKILELQFAGVAPPDQPYAGQALYRERGRQHLLDGRLIPEQDLHFVD
jgi:hypothetical protein